ncbi:hypothetical protein N656DRAFT_329718 [Canariomyces notabilis]|uniref:Uncharacterized protein n=1 Tax=Canariomyces notabilis TaxID=2074819 RepID=A0AAN6TA34_9PEZI|nr:hypothetical protein N656DRAFT_329718 [Canariomyces arenarius]
MGKNRTAIAWFLSGRGFGALSSDGGDLQKYDWTDAHGEVRGIMGLANQRCVWRSLVWAGSWIAVEFRTVNRGGFVLRACDCKMLRAPVLAKPCQMLASQQQVCHSLVLRSAASSSQWPADRFDCNSRCC